mgnify:CR=1 FL=1
MTGTMDATDEFIILDSGTGEKRKAASEIGLSIFNNDSGFTTNVGDITGVTAGSGMTGGGSSGDLTLNVIGGDGITANADDVAVDSTVVRTSGSQTIAGAKTFSNDAVFNGNLTVNGTQTVVNTETLTVDDNIIVLNNNESGTPSQNAGIEVERGSSTNVLFRYNVPH